MGLNTIMNITGEMGSPWKVPVLNGNLAVVHDGPVITPVSREYMLVIYVDTHSGKLFRLRVYSISSWFTDPNASARSNNLQ